MLETLLTYGLPALVGFLGFFGRSLMQRFEKLERNMESKLTEQQTRQILADKLEPVKETLDDVQAKLDRLYDLLLK